MAKTITKTIKTANVVAFELDKATMQVFPSGNFEVVGGISEQKALKFAKANISRDIIAVQIEESEKRYRMSVEDFVKYGVVVDNDETDEDENDD